MPTEKTNMKNKTVLHSLISVGTYQDFIQEIFYLAQHKIPSYVCFANVHMVVEGYKNKNFQKIINNANIVAPDGKPISLFLNYFDKLKQVRVCGMDMFPDLLKQAEVLDKSVYFYGTTDALLTAVINKTREKYPLLRISGFYSPPFREISEEENSAIIKRIKSTSPDLIFVSLGCPKQEKWIADNKNKIGACLLGVGQAFSVFADVENRLPMWMRNLSLEWAYRLYQEPKRLWKRYLFTNSYFVYLTFNHVIAQLRSKLLSSFSKSYSSGKMLQEADE